MGSMLKKLFMTVLGTVVTAYVTKTVTQALERKPLKARVREGKAKAVQMRDVAAAKASTMKSQAQSKAADLKFAAQMKAEQAKAKANSLIEERPVVVEKEVETTVVAKPVSDENNKGM